MLSYLKIKQILGETCTKLSELCTSPKINMWSKYKPVRYGKLEKLTEEDRKSVNYGILIANCSVNLSNSNLARLAYSLSTGSSKIDNFIYLKWKYLSPRGKTEREYFRLGDFDNYQHNAKPPFWITTNFGYNSSDVTIPSFDILFKYISLGSIDSLNFKLNKNPDANGLKFEDLISGNPKLMINVYSCVSKNWYNATEPLLSYNILLSGSQNEINIPMSQLIVGALSDIRYFCIVVGIVYDNGGKFTVSPVPITYSKSETNIDYYFYPIAIGTNLSLANMNVSNSNIFILKSLGYLLVYKLNSYYTISSVDEELNSIVFRFNFINNSGETLNWTSTPTEDSNNLLIKAYVNPENKKIVKPVRYSASINLNVDLIDIPVYNPKYGNLYYGQLPYFSEIQDGIPTKIYLTYSIGGEDFEYPITSITVRYLSVHVIDPIEIPDLPHPGDIEPVNNEDINEFNP